MELNKQQIKAIETIQGPVMVISCAGSGKTTVITERVNEIIKAGISAKNVLVVTFSKAAALEMAERFEKRFHQYDVKFATIHSVCYSVLANAYGMKATSILKVSEKKAFFRDEYFKFKKEYGKAFENQYKDLDDFYKEIELKISGYMTFIYKENLYDYEKAIKDKFTRMIYGDYQKFKKMNEKIDYDDMIIECHRCLTAKKEILKYWQSVFQYIMIDEFQDTNILQAEIFYLLAGESKNICVVGDDDQSIYSFRDADSFIFDKFLEKYPETQKICLDINYRSEPEIIDFASRLIVHNNKRFDKNFKTYKTGKAKVEELCVNENAKQTDAIIRIIKTYQNQGVALKDIAILYRVKKEAALIFNRLKKEEIPFYTKEIPEDIHSGMIYQDIKAYYRLANDMWGSTDLRRIINRPKRYLKSEIFSNCPLNKQEILKRCFLEVTDGERKEQINRTIEKLFLDLKKLKGKTPILFMDYLKNEMLYREGLIEYADFIKADSKVFTDIFDELHIEAKKFHTMLEWDNYVEECRKKISDSIQKNRETGVHLSTFHSAKGLEWKKVIIISANDGVTPLIRENEIENPEEERRLFYVALTRAEEEVCIIHFSDDKEESKNRVPPSRYIYEMQEGAKTRIEIRNV